jgi:hypothetical protein
MMVVSVETDPTFRAGRPEISFKGRYVTSRIMRGIPFYDISPDGPTILNDQDSRRKHRPNQRRPELV